MRVTQSHGINWWVGSNGNLFGDYNGFRYCIQHRSDGEYTVMRDGFKIAIVPTMVDAKIYVKREGR